jgi:hypothetical protein
MTSTAGLTSGVRLSVPGGKLARLRLCPIAQSAPGWVGNLLAMYPVNAYVIREATKDDQATLAFFEELDGRGPLRGRVLIGEVDGLPAGVASVSDGRVVGDPLQPTHFLLPMLGMRARAQRTFERLPSLPARLAAGYA